MIPTGLDLLRAVEAAAREGKSQAQLAGEWGISWKALDNRLYRARRAAEAAGLDWQPEPYKVILGEPLHLSGDAAVVGDVHVPCTDYELARLVGAVAARYLKRPRKLIIAGDFWNFDAYSHYAAVVTPPDWKQEREAGRRLLKEWGAQFDELYFIMGNHDRRIQKWMLGNFDDEDMRTLMQSDKVKVSNFGYCILSTPNGDWRITHPKNYSINQLVVADQLAQKYDASILSFHEHHLSIGLDRYSRHTIVNGGCLVDPGKLAYVSLDDSKAGGMARGFCILRNGYPYLFGDKLTDWEAWI